MYDLTVYMAIWGNLHTKAYIFNKHQPRRNKKTNPTLHMNMVKRPPNVELINVFYGGWHSREAPLGVLVLSTHPKRVAVRPTNVTVPANVARIGELCLGSGN